MTNAPHTASPSATEQRLTELEIQASYADDLLDTLNAQVARQQGTGDGMAAPGNPRDELPPHY